MQKDRVLIYGAGGNTGRKVVAQLEALANVPHTQLIAAARSPLSLPDVKGQRNAIETRQFPLEHTLIARELHDVQLVVNAAGPFVNTALPVARACMATNTHYLDISGELGTFQQLRNEDEQAKKYHMSLTPGVGLSVLVSSALARHAWYALCDKIDADPTLPPHTIRFAFSRLDHMSRGSARTVLESIREGVLVRRNGKVTLIQMGSLEREFEFDGKQRRICSAMNMPEPIALSHGDLAAPNIEAYVETNTLERIAAVVGAELAVGLRSPRLQKMGDRVLSVWPDLLETEQRVKQQIVVEVEDRYERQARAVLVTENAYSVTADAVAHMVAQRLAQRDAAPIGFTLPVLDDLIAKLQGNVTLELLGV